MHSYHVVTHKRQSIKECTLTMLLQQKTKYKRMHSLPCCYNKRQSIKWCTLTMLLQQKTKYKRMHSYHVVTTKDKV